MFAKILNRYKGLPRQIYILFFARIINSIGAFVHPLLTLIMTEKLGISSSTAGIYMTIMMATMLPSMMIGGKLADKFGRRKLLIVAQTVGATLYLVCGFIEMSNVSLVLIVLATNFYAASYPAISAIATDLTNPKNRKEAFSLLYMGINIGFAVGPTIGGLLFENYLSFVFIGDALTSLLSIVLIAIFIKETLPAKDDISVSDLEKAKKGSLLKILLERKIILLTAVVLFIFQFSYIQMGFTLPIQMADFFANGAKNYGLLISFNGVLVIFSTPLIMHMIKKWKTLYATFVGGLLYTAAFAMLIFVKELPSFYAAMFLLTLGEVIIAVDAYAFIANIAPLSHRGRINSFISIVENLGRMISPVIIGQVIVYSSLGIGWFVVSSIAFLGAMLLFIFINIGSIKKEIGTIET